MTAWSSISTATLSDRVYSSIRDRILRGTLAPGQFLRELEVATALGVSRTPVREALARLAREGFIEGQARRGYRMPREPIGRLLELYPIVAALEVLAGELAFPAMGPEVLARLRKLNARCRRAQRGPARESIEANNHFHHVLSEGCGNEQLGQLLDTLRAQIVRLEVWSAQHAEHVAEAIHQHEAIIEAIERKDFPAALALLRVNRLQTYTAYFDELGGSGAKPRKPPKSPRRPKRRITTGAHRTGAPGRQAERSTRVRNPP